MKATFVQEPVGQTFVAIHQSHAQNRSSRVSYAKAGRLPFACQSAAPVRSLRSGHRCLPQHCSQQGDCSGRVSGNSKSSTGKISFDDKEKSLRRLM